MPGRPLSPMRKARGRRWRSDRVPHEHHDAPDVGFVAGVNGALGAALVERAQDPAPVTLDAEPDDGFPVAPGVTRRVQPNGVRPWVFRYRSDGKPHRVTPRKPDAVKADDARPAALPSSLARRAAANPFASLLPARLSRCSPPSIWNGARPGGSRPPGQRSGAISTAILPALGHLRVGSVVRADVARFFHVYGRRKPGGANRYEWAREIPEGDALQALLDISIERESLDPTPRQSQTQVAIDDAEHIETNAKYPNGRTATGG